MNPVFISYVIIGLWTVFGTFHGAIAQTYGDAGAPPRVPKYVRFDKLKIRLTDHAQNEIQDKVNKLWEGQKSLDTKAARARMYFPLIEQVFKAEGVPLDFKYLAIQESALLGHAVSTSRAVGYWQFKTAAAKEVGLRMDRMIDERKHIITATKGAARYLKRQQLVFKNWMYALTAYYTGRGGAHPYVHDKYVGKTAMVISKRNHWYIKWFLAYRIVFRSKLRARSSNPMHFKLYALKGERSLDEVASRFKVNTRQLRAHNRWLQGKQIPKGIDLAVLVPMEGRGNWTLRRPAQKQVDKVKRAVQVPFKRLTQKLSQWVDVKTRQTKLKPLRINGCRALVAGEKEKWKTLLARSGKSERQLLRYNDLNEPLLILPTGAVYYTTSKRVKSAAYYHILQRNESLWEVAQRYGIRLSALRSLNRLRPEQAPRAGYRLHLRQKRKRTQKPVYDPLPERPKKRPVKPIAAMSAEDKIANAFQKALHGWIPDDNEEDKAAILPPLPPFHIVEPGETLFAVSRKYKVNIHRLLHRNGLTMRSLSYPGQKLYLPKRLMPNPVLAAEEGIYVVQPGDTLYGIARKYRTSVSALMQLNKKQTTRLNIGETLRLR